MPRSRSVPGKVTSARSRSSSARIRASHSARRTSSRARRPMPRTRYRSASSRRGPRSARFRRGAEFRPWLLRIVVNEAHNRRRSAQRRESLALRAAFADVPPGDAVPSPEATALDQEQRQELLDAVNRLDERDRDVLACRYFLELSERETAEVLGVRTGRSSREPRGRSSVFERRWASERARAAARRARARARRPCGTRPRAARSRPDRRAAGGCPREGASFSRSR